MNTFDTSREIPSPVADVFAAFSDAERLARWWGPAGFTNTFYICDFETGGRWSYAMHSPNGGSPKNESIFETVDPMKKVVIDHVSEPKYRLTIDFAATETGTLVSWSQRFESDEVAGRIAKIVIPANEQNLDRLSVEVAKTRATEE